MPDSTKDSVSSEGRPKLDQRYIGKFILWAVIALVGWSLFSTMRHETEIAVIHEKLEFIGHSIKIDQRLREIQDSILAMRK